jgi:hypothetical protein
LTSIDRTAYPRFKRTMSAREIVDVFTPSAGEVEWARDKTTAAPNMLALVVWLKSFQYLGCLSGLLGLPPGTLRAFARRGTSRNRAVWYWAATLPRLVRHGDPAGAAQDDIGQSLASTRRKSSSPMRTTL